jgi:two-component system, chemotaxis family, chemotaxis protein CheY
MENPLKAGARPLRVLVVDDEGEIRNLIRFCLAGCARCDLAADGRLALEKFSAALQAGQPYDLVLLDILMPDLNGRQVLEKMRELERLAGKDAREGVKIVMLTALDDTANVLQSFKRGCDSYLVKPFDEAGLLQEVQDAGLGAAWGQNREPRERPPGHEPD